MIKNMFEKIESSFLHHPKIKDQLGERLYYTIYRKLNRFKEIIYNMPLNFVYNIWNFRKILLTDYWFDHYYLINMIQIKLENDYKKYLKYGISVESKLIAKEMEYCSILLNKINSDNYNENHLREYEKKWGKFSLEDLNDNNILNTTTEEENEFRQHIINADEEKLNDTIKVFNFISKRIHTWWD